MFSTWLAVRIAAAASAGTLPTPLPRRQLSSIIAIIARASSPCASNAGARSTPTDKTCETSAASLVRSEWQQ
jgi:hypothetical protein